MVDLRRANIDFEINQSEVKKIIDLFESNDSKLEALELLIKHVNSVDGLYDLLETQFNRKEKKELKSILSEG